MTPTQHAPTILLFDIDGTLIDAGGTGKRALERAFLKCFEKQGAFNHLSFGGMTDFAIIRAGLEQTGAESGPIEIHRVLEIYLRYLEEEVAQADRYRIHPGVVELLCSLSDRPDLALGLGTGNVRRGAEIKLERGGLNRFFSFGGFGCDHELRPTSKHGAIRGADRLRRPLSACRVVVIGDTPLDILAARSIGAQVVAVSTGSSPAGELAAYDPDALVANLEDPAVFPVLLGLTQTATPPGAR